MASTEVPNNTKAILEKGALDIIVNALKNRTLSGAVYYSTNSNDPTDTNNLWIEIDQYDVGSYNIYLRIYVNETKGWRTIYQGSYNYVRPQVEFLNPNNIDMFSFFDEPLSETGVTLLDVYFYAKATECIYNIADQCNGFMTDGGLFSEWLKYLMDADDNEILLTDVIKINDESELKCELVAEMIVENYDLSYGRVTLNMTCCTTFSEGDTVYAIFSFFEEPEYGIANLLYENIIVETSVNEKDGTLRMEIPINVFERFDCGMRAAFMIIYV